MSLARYASCVDWFIFARVIDVKSANSGRKTLEILCPIFHKEKVIYTMNKFRLPRIKTAPLMHPFGEPTDKPSTERKQQNLDCLALRTTILAQRLEDGLVKT